MNWSEERRANRAAAAEQSRLDAAAASQRRIAEQAAAAEQSRVDSDVAVARAERDRDRRTARRAGRWSVVRGWLAAHRVALLVYPLAVASAVMAVPSMAVFGMQVYGTAAGVVLPVLTELGMWAFALAVETRRQAAPQAPLWTLRCGVWTFAGIGFTINALHGFDLAGWSAAVVMGIASIAGVVAHQIVTATGDRRTREQRRTDRAARTQTRIRARKENRIRRAAVRHAVAELDADGTARLVFAPGRYVLHPRRLHRLRRPRLVAAIDLTTEPQPFTAPRVSEPDWVTEVTPVADEVAAWLAGRSGPTIAVDGTRDQGPIATLDPRDRGDADAAAASGGATGGSGADPSGTRQVAAQRESTPTTPRNQPRKPAGTSRRKAKRTAPPPRSLDELRSELRDALAADPASIDPHSAESIRKALRCSPDRARQLRNEQHSN